MKAVTANLLTDGAVVYLDRAGNWTPHIRHAALYEDDKARQVLEKAATRITEVADLYLMDTAEHGIPAGRARLREAIRAAGPTVRKDLGYQADDST